MKTCSKCNTTKPLTEFHKDKTRKDGFRNQCTECIKEYQQINKERIAERGKVYNQINKERRAERDKEYYQINKERILAHHKVYNQINKERQRQYRQINKERDKQYRQINKERRAEYYKEYYQINKERKAERSKEYYQNNKERIRERDKLYRQNNKERIRERDKQYNQYNKESRREYIKNRLQTDELFKAKTSIRALIRRSISKMGYTKKSKTYQILGCSFDEFKTHIEQQFAPGMTWDNRELWHLDHIIPLSLGLTEEEVIALNHYTNFQPLWEEDNLSKSNNINWEKDPSKYGL